MNQYRPGGFRGLTPVVKNLLILNVIFFIATYAVQSAMQFDLTEYLALFYYKSDYFQPYQFITHMFMHGGIWHLFFNMFALWMFGKNIEMVWGPKRFLIYYFITGLGAAALHTLVNWYTFSGLEEAIALYSGSPSPEAFVIFMREHFSEVLYNPEFIETWMARPMDTSMANQSVEFINNLYTQKLNVPTVGASGAVFGVLLAFGMLFPNVMLYVYFAIPIKAKYFVIIYGALELYAGVMNQPGDNIAHFAHLGGMIFGFLLILLWKKNQFNRWN